jgi:hypothetical protein
VRRLVEMNAVSLSCSNSLLITNSPSYFSALVDWQPTDTTASARIRVSLRTGGLKYRTITGSTKGIINQLCCQHGLVVMHALFDPSPVLHLLVWLQAHLFWYVVCLTRRIPSAFDAYIQWTEVFHQQSS